MELPAFAWPNVGIEKVTRSSSRKSRGIWGDGLVSSLTSGPHGLRVLQRESRNGDAESREDMERIYGTMPLVELADRQVESARESLRSNAGSSGKLVQMNLRKS
jgi:hypothetical protein